MKNRTLSLNREALTELSIDALNAVVGAEAPHAPPSLEGGLEGLGYCLTTKGSRCIY